MGYIYIIKNTVNNKVYIGQTVQSIEARWYKHINEDAKLDTKLGEAFRRIGSDKFFIEILDEVDNNELNEAEKKYIAMYNSFHNGYNSTLGGGGSQKISKAERLEIANQLKNKSITGVAISNNISTTLVKQIKKQYNIESDTEIKKSNKPKSLIMYDLKFNIDKCFSSIREAFNFIKNKYNKVSDYNFYTQVKVACQNGNIAYGHRWQLASDLIYEDKIFRTKFDKEAYIQGKHAYQPEGKNYWVVDGVISYEENIKSYCVDCGIEISKGSNRCIHCYKKYIKNIVKSDIKPDKDTLKLLLQQHSYEAIGRMYNVTGKAVRKWADSYGLVTSRPIDRTGVTCVELNMYFKTFKEAAEYLIEKRYTSAADLKNVTYNISNAKKNNHKYIGFNWK